MRKQILLFITGALLLTGSMTISAEEVLYAEDFESGAVQNWGLEQGWKIEQYEENFVLGGDGHHWARLQGGNEWGDYTFRAHVRLIRGGIHLNYRVSEAGRYFIGIREHGLYLNKETPWGNFFELAVNEMSIEIDAWHIVEVRGQENVIQVYFDGLLAMEIDDDDPLTVGGIAFETVEDSLAFIDNVEVLGMQATPEYAEMHEEHPVWNMPDLAVTDLSVEPDRVHPGETVFLRATVSNIGTGTTEPVRMVFLVDKNEVGQTVIGPLGPSNRQPVRTAWVANGPGSHRVTSRIEIEQDVFDEDARNNQLESVVRVAGQENPPVELEVTLVDSDRSRFETRIPTDLTFNVRNPGFTGAENIQLELYVDEKMIASEFIEQLAPGRARDLHIAWNHITPGEHLVELRTALPEGMANTEFQPVKSWHFSFPDQTHLFHKVEKDKWTSIGPRIIGQKFQGRLHKMALDPKDSKVLYVTTPRGGIWKTATAGKQTKGKTTWTPLGDKLGTIFGGAVAVDPQNSGIVYYATGFSHDPTGVGIYKSLDGGKQWSLFASRQIVGGASNLFVRYTKKKEVLIYAGTNRGVLRYKNSNPKLLQSNVTEWDLIKNGQVRDLEISPTDNSLIYASIEHDGLWRTRKGETAMNNTSDWEDITNEMPSNLAPVIDVYDSNPKILYASVRHPNPIGRIDVFFTDDEGDSWTNILSKNDGNRGNDTHYNPFIRAHPSKQVIYYGGGRLYKSELQNNSWKETENYGTHVDLHDVVFDVHRPDYYYQLNDGGIWHCQYKKGTRDDCDNRNYDLRVTEIYDFDVSQATPNLMIGGTQDNGTILFDGSLDWKHIRGGDGYYSLVGTKNKVTNKNKDKLVFYSQDQDLRSTRRTDSGFATDTSHWLPGSEEVKKGYPKGLPSGYKMRSGWITLHSNLKLDKYVLSAGDQVYASTDGGINWNPKGPDPKAGNVRLNSHIRRVVVQPKTYDWFAANNKGQIFYTSNPTMGWNVLFDHPYDAEVTSLAFAPGNHKVLYATFDTSETKAYFRIMRFEFHPPPQAISMSYIADNFPIRHKHPDDVKVSLNVISGDAHNDLTAYVGTNKGVFRGKTACDGCTWNWQPYNAGLPLAIVNDLLVVPETKELRAATQGRGAWTVVTGL